MRVKILKSGTYMVLNSKSISKTITGNYVPVKQNLFDKLLARERVLPEFAQILSGRNARSIIQLKAGDEVEVECIVKYTNKGNQSKELYKKLADILDVEEKLTRGELDPIAFISSLHEVCERVRDSNQDQRELENALSAGTTPNAPSDLLDLVKNANNQATERKDNVDELLKEGEDLIKEIEKTLNDKKQNPAPKVEQDNYEKKASPYLRVLEGIPGKVFLPQNSTEVLPSQPPYESSGSFSLEGNPKLRNFELGLIFNGPDAFYKIMAAMDIEVLNLESSIDKSTGCITEISKTTMNKKEFENIVFLAKGYAQYAKRTGELV